MAFDQVTSKVPTSLGNIVVYLKDRLAVGEEPASQTIMADIVVLDAGGGVLTTVHVDLEPHLTANQVTTLKNFLTTIRTKATAEIIS